MGVETLAGFQITLLVGVALQVPDLIHYHEMLAVAMM